MSTPERPPASICLIDTSVYVYRARRSRPLERRPPADDDAPGRPAEADAIVAGFAVTLSDLLAAERPTHALCALDTCGRRGVRNALYPPYKRARPPTPPALVAALERCAALARALGVAALGSDRVEADDVIGHFARLARDDGRTVTIVSGDKDLAQFVGPGDRLLDHGRRSAEDARAIERRLGVRPARIPDWLALAGDAADGLPGVPGVGRATAARLLRKWGSLALVLANLDGVARMRFRGAPAVAERLAEHAERARLARRLAGAFDDPALPRSLEAIRRVRVPRETLRDALVGAGVERREAEGRAEAIDDALPATDALSDPATRLGRGERPMSDRARPVRRARPKHASTRPSAAHIGTSDAPTPASAHRDRRLLALNKPYGTLCQFRDAEERPTLADLVALPGLYPAGRLDRDSEGLLLLTGDGALQHRLSHPRHKLPKRYLVQLDGEIDDAALGRLRRGVALRDGPARAIGVERCAEPDWLWPREPPVRRRARIPTSWIGLVLDEGRNRQVRRMTAAAGFPTLRLVRVAIGPYALDGLGPGEHRFVSAERLARLARRSRGGS